MASYRIPTYSPQNFPCHVKLRNLCRWKIMSRHSQFVIFSRILTYRVDQKYVYINLYTHIYIYYILNTYFWPTLNDVLMRYTQWKFVQPCIIIPSTCVAIWFFFRSLSDSLYIPVYIVHLTTVASHFPSTRLTYKTSDCNLRRVCWMRRASASRRQIQICVA
jgi:hypothetical protein